MSVLLRCNSLLGRATNSDTVDLGTGPDWLGWSGPRWDVHYPLAFWRTGGYGEGKRRTDVRERTCAYPDAVWAHLQNLAFTLGLDDFDMSWALPGWTPRGVAHGRHPLTVVRYRAGLRGAAWFSWTTLWESLRYVVDYNTTKGAGAPGRTETVAVWLSAGHFDLDARGARKWFLRYGARDFAATIGPRLDWMATRTVGTTKAGLCQIDPVAIEPYDEAWRGHGIGWPFDPVTVIYWAGIVDDQYVQGAWAGVFASNRIDNEPDSRWPLVLTPIQLTDAEVAVGVAERTLLVDYPDDPNRDRVIKAVTLRFKWDPSQPNAQWPLTTTKKAMLLPRTSGYFQVALGRTLPIYDEGSAYGTTAGAAPLPSIYRSRSLGLEPAAIFTYKSSGDSALAKLDVDGILPVSLRVFRYWVLPGWTGPAKFPAIVPGRLSPPFPPFGAERLVAWAALGFMTRYGEYGNDAGQLPVLLRFGPDSDTLLMRPREFPEAPYRGQMDNTVKLFPLCTNTKVRLLTLSYGAQISGLQAFRPEDSAVAALNRWETPDRGTGSQIPAGDAAASFLGAEVSDDRIVATAQHVILRHLIGPGRLGKHLDSLAKYIDAKYRKLGWLTYLARRNEVPWAKYLGAYEVKRNTFTQWETDERGVRLTYKMSRAHDDYGAEQAAPVAQPFLRRHVTDLQLDEVYVPATPVIRITCPSYLPWPTPETPDEGGPPWGGWVEYEDHHGEWGEDVTTTRSRFGDGPQVDSFLVQTYNDTATYGPAWSGGVPNLTRGPFGWPDYYKYSTAYFWRQQQVTVVSQTDLGPTVHLRVLAWELEHGDVGPFLRYKRLWKYDPYPPHYGWYVDDWMLDWAKSLTPKMRQVVLLIPLARQTPIAGGAYEYGAKAWQDWLDPDTTPVLFEGWTPGRDPNSPGHWPYGCVRPNSKAQFLPSYAGPSLPGLATIDEVDDVWTP